MEELPGPTAASLREEQLQKLQQIRDELTRFGSGLSRFNPENDELSRALPTQIGQRLEQLTTSASLFNDQWYTRTATADSALQAREATCTILETRLVDRENELEQKEKDNGAKVQARLAAFTEALRLQQQQTEDNGSLRKQVEDLTKENEELKEKLRDRDEDKATALNQAEAECQNAKGALQQQINTLQAEKADVPKRLAEAERQGDVRGRATVQNEIERVTAEATKAKASAATEQSEKLIEIEAQCKKEWAAKVSELTASAQQLTATSGEMQKATTVMNEATVKANAAATTSQKIVEEVASSRAAHVEELKRNAVDVDGLASKIADVKSAVDTVADHTQAISNAQKSLNDLKDDVSTLQSSLDGLYSPETDIAAVSALVTELMTAVDGLPTILATLYEILTHPQHGLEQLKGDIDRVGVLSARINAHLVDNHHGLSAIRAFLPAIIPALTDRESGLPAIIAALTNRQSGLRAIIVAANLIHDLLVPSPRTAPGGPEPNPTLADSILATRYNTTTVRAYFEDIFGYRTDYRGTRLARHPNERSQLFIDVLTGFSGLLQQLGTTRTAVEASQPVLQNIQTGIAALPRAAINRNDVRQVLQGEDIASNSALREVRLMVEDMRPVSAAELRTALTTITTITQEDVREVLEDPGLPSNAALQQLGYTLDNLHPISSADLQAALNDLPTTTITREDVHEVFRSLDVNASLNSLTTAINNMRPVSAADLQADLHNINQALLTQDDVLEVVQDLNLASNESLQQLTTTVSNMQPVTAAELDSALNDLATILQGPDASNITFATIQDALLAAKLTLDGLPRDTEVASVQVKLDKIKNRLNKLTQSMETPARQTRPATGTPSGHAEKERRIDQMERMRADAESRQSRASTDPFASTPRHRPSLKLRRKQRPQFIVTGKALGTAPVITADSTREQQEEIDAQIALAMADGVIKARQEAVSAEERLNALLVRSLGEVSPEEIDKALLEAAHEAQQAYNRQLTTASAPDLVDELRHRLSNFYDEREDLDTHARLRSLWKSLNGRKGQIEVANAPFEVWEPAIDNARANILDDLQILNEQIEEAQEALDGEQTAAEANNLLQRLMQEESAIVRTIEAGQVLATRQVDPESANAGPTRIIDMNAAIGRAEGALGIVRGLIGDLNDRIAARDATQGPEEDDTEERREAEFERTRLQFEETKKRREAERLEREAEARRKENERAEAMRKEAEREVARRQEAERESARIQEASRLEAERGAEAKRQKEAKARRPSDVAPETPKSKAAEQAEMMTRLTRGESTRGEPTRRLRTTTSTPTLRGSSLKNSPSIASLRRQAIPSFDTWARSLSKDDLLGLIDFAGVRSTTKEAFVKDWKAYKPQKGKEKGVLERMDDAARRKREHNWEGGDCAIPAAKKTPGYARQDEKRGSGLRKDCPIHGKKSGACGFLEFIEGVQQPSKGTIAPPFNAARQAVNGKRFRFVENKLEEGEEEPQSEESSHGDGPEDDDESEL